MRSPTLNEVGSNSHIALRLSAGTSTPLGMKQLPLPIAMSLSGRWMPSNIVPRIPGPSSRLSGFPLRVTGSPTVSPDVSS